MYRAGNEPRKSTAETSIGVASIVPDCAYACKPTISATLGAARATLASLSSGKAKQLPIELNSRITMKESLSRQVSIGETENRCTALAASH